MRIRAVMFAILWLCDAPATAAAPDLVLYGTITGADHQHFIAQPFTVPTDATAIIVDFSYDRSAGTVIDLGLLDDQRFRGWSGGNKARFLVGDTRATLSYLSGPVAGRRVTLLLGVPNARTASRADWRAEIRFERGQPSPEPLLRTGPGWYRGDLHTHTGHSDGNCANDAGTRVPCPAYRSIEAAARAGLDFVALTDHNTVSHMGDLLALQPAFTKLLLIPGQEVTTFFGHANVLGPVAVAEFRVGTPQIPDGAAWARAIAPLGGLVSVNHPGLPSGEACMGCGWTMPNTDWRRVAAIEIANGGSMAIAGNRLDTPLSGIPFWEKRLDEGHRLAPIAGSDNHDPGLLSPDARAIGTIVTAVWADALSTADILDGIRRGRVFVDTDAAAGRTLDMVAVTATGAVAMGGTVRVAADTDLPITVTVTRCPGCTLTLIYNGTALAPSPVTDAAITTRLRIDRPGWVRAEIRDPRGRLILVGNAIHLALAGEDDSSKASGARGAALYNEPDNLILMQGSTRPSGSSGRTKDATAKDGGGQNSGGGMGGGGIGGGNVGGYEQANALHDGPTPRRTNDDKLPGGNAPTAGR